MADDLIARLEAATEGSRELSDECLLAVGWEYDRGEPMASSAHREAAWYSPDGDRTGVFGPPHVTASLDDAIRWMVPEGAYWWQMLDLAYHALMRVPVDRRTPEILILLYCAECLKARADG